MRISSLFIPSTMLQNFERNNGAINKLQEQMFNEKRINRPSDDPVASCQQVQINRETSTIAQYQKNIKGLSNSLRQHEIYVNAMIDRVDKLKIDLLSVSNETHKASDMTGFGNNISADLDSIIAEINSKDEDGHYLFSGTKTDKQTVTYHPATKQYTYNGNSASSETTVANGVNVKGNTDLSGIFSTSGSDLDALNKLKALSEKMKKGTIDPATYRREITGAIGAIASCLDKLSGVQTELGAKQNQLTMLNNAHTDISIVNNEVAKTLVGATNYDYVKTVNDLNQYYMSIQNSNKVYIKLSQLSLFDFLG